MRRFIFAFMLLSASVWAQQPSSTPTPNPGVKNEEEKEPATEAGKFRLDCITDFHIAGCAELLFTGQPLHIAVGSIAPQNGFGAGLAYVGHKDTDNWSKSWSTDAIGSSNASWRVGFFLKFVDTHIQPSDVTMGTAGANPDDIQPYAEYPVYTIYEQSISLNKLIFFGEGPATTTAGRSFFGMTEHIVGGNIVRPIYEKLNMSFLGEINGRLPDIRLSTGQNSPSIEALYAPATAPGLAHQPFFLQLGAGLRMRPSAAKNLLQFDYSAMYQPFIDTDGSGFSFQRLTFDLHQEISFYHRNVYEPRDTNDPNDCRIDPTDAHSTCPHATSRTKQGALGLRAFTSLSMTPGNNVVPFYFQPTLGGSDINGNSTLSSYQDYRFRAPNVLLLEESLDHSIGHWPFGVALRADQGKVALLRGDLGSNSWRHSYAAGLTLRAGGFPMVYLLFAFGGQEGTHTIANVNTSLLGSSARPSLF
ncbi:MAG TPA: hypothetical protein VFB79_13180 [Candidatus Angelobacter sp.]|nr:hypothetical protein [Candidatus Angelobacter sp.]